MAGRAVRPSLPRDRRDALLGRRARARSSAGQSARLISVRSAVRVGPGPPSLRDGTTIPPGVVGGQRVPGPPAPSGGRPRAAPRRRCRSLFTSCGGVVLAGLPDPLGPAEAGLTGGGRPRPLARGAPV